MNFVAIDVETANSDLSSICQVGIATFDDGVLRGTWESLVNPEVEFDEINVSIHGITERDVRRSPNWGAVYSKVSALLRDQIVVSHTAFDRVAVLRACDKGKLTQCGCQWLDSAQVVRRAWPRFSHSGYGLANVASEFGIQYRQHDALEDARCAGEILLRAISETGLGVDQWITRVERPINPSYQSRITRDANPNGQLHGEVLVFTGNLSMSRDQAANAASLAGCEVDASVTKRTTLLVVGDQDTRKLAGYEKSSKQRKAEELVSRGQKIRIIGEDDFQHIIKVNGAAHLTFECSQVKKVAPTKNSGESLTTRMLRRRAGRRPAPTKTTSNCANRSVGATQPCHPQGWRYIVQHMRTKRQKA